MTALSAGAGGAASVAPTSDGLGPPPAVLPSTPPSEVVGREVVFAPPAVLPALPQEPHPDLALDATALRLNLGPRID